MRGQPALNLIHDVVVDSCRVFGRIIVDYENDADFTMRHSTMTGPGSYAIALATSAGCHVENNVIRGFDNGFSASVSDGVLIVRNNVIEGCPGVALHAHFGSGGSAVFSGNDVRDCGVAVAIDDVRADVTDNLILDSRSDGIRFNGYSGTIERNVVGRSGGRGIFISPGDDYVVIAVLNNTSFGNDGSGFEVTYDGHLDAVTRVERNISYGNHGHGLVVGAGSRLPDLSCNDWFANDSGAVAGTSPSSTDLSIDPDFCSLSEDDAHLIAGSPLLDMPGCGLIGALGQGCTPTGTLDARLTAERLLEGVRLRWQLSGGTPSTRISVERADRLDGPWTTIAAEMSRDGDATAAIDRDAAPGREYWYRLRAQDGAEWQTVGSPVFVEASLARGFELVGATPDPGAGPVRIRYTLPHEARVDLDVFDVQGRHVASLIHGPMPVGTHTSEWGELAGDLPKARSGIYLVRYRFPGGQQVLRFVRSR